MVEEEKILVPNWVIKDLSDTFRLIHNFIINKGMKGCLPRMIFKNELQINRLLNGEEVTGREYLEAIKMEANIKVEDK